METKTPRTFDASTTIGVLTIGVVFAVLFAILWKMGLFNLAATQSGAQVVAAVLGLLGVIGTATVALVGYLLKRSFDAHSLRLQESTEKRLSLEAEQNRKRLDMETAIRAVGLMSTQAGTDASVTQKSGALFALVTLDQIDLALALVDQLWPQEEGIDSGTAVWVIDKALQSDVRRHQVEASTILENNSDNLYTDDSSFFWPECLYLEWDKDIDFEARNSALLTLLRVLVGRPKEWWAFGSLLAILEILQHAITTEGDTYVKAGAVLAQECLLRHLTEGHLATDFNPDADILSRTGNIAPARMRENADLFKKQEGVSARERAPFNIVKAVDEMEKWAMGQAQTKLPGVREPAQG